MASTIRTWPISLLPPEHRAIPELDEALHAFEEATAVERREPAKGRREANRAAEQVHEVQSHLIKLGRLPNWEGSSRGA